MMFTLRGLPPGIEIPEIRSYIHERCAVRRVLLDELEADVGGTQRVTVATIRDIDAATLQRALSGERLGVYTLLVEACQPPDTSTINSVRDVNNLDNSPYNTHEGLQDNSGDGGYGRRATGSSFRLGGNTKTNFSGSGGIVRSCGSEGGDLDSLGVSNWRDCGGLGGLEEHNTIDDNGLSNLNSDTRRNDGGWLNFGGHNVHFHGKGSGSLGKHHRDEDSIDRHRLKRQRETSERDTDLGSVGAITFKRISKGLDVPYGSPGRGEHSGTDSSHGGGLVGCANRSQAGYALGLYYESFSFVRSGISERNAIRDHNPHPYDNKNRESRPPWVRQSQIEEHHQSAEIEDCPITESRTGKYSEANGYLRQREPPMHIGKMQKQNKEAIEPTSLEPSANADQMKEVTQSIVSETHSSWQPATSLKKQRHQLQEQQNSPAPKKKHMSASRLRKSRERMKALKAKKRASMTKPHVTPPASGPSEPAALVLLGLLPVVSNSLKEKMKEAIEPTLLEPSGDADQMKEVIQSTVPETSPSWQPATSLKKQRHQSQKQQMPPAPKKKHLSASRLRKSRERMKALKAEKRARIMKAHVPPPASDPTEPAALVPPELPPVKSNSLKKEVAKDEGSQRSWSPVRKGSWRPEGGAQLPADIQQFEPHFDPPVPNMIPIQAEMVNNTMTIITAPFPAPKPVPPLVGPGASHFPFPINPLHQFESGLQKMQTQVGPHIQPIGMQPTFISAFQPMSMQTQFNPPGQPIVMKTQFNPPVQPMGITTQFNPPVQPMGMQPQFKPPVCIQPPLDSLIQNMETSVFNHIQSKNKSLKTKNHALANPELIREQKYSQNLPQHSREHYITYDVAANTEKQMSPIEKQSSAIYMHDSSNIVTSMVDCTKMNEKNNDVVSFVCVLRHLIGERLRELTNGDPFDKDLVSIYRKAYPPLTDEEAMMSACKQLSIPGYPIQPKVFPFLHKILRNTRCFDHIVEGRDIGAVDVTKYVNSELKMDTNYKKSDEDNVNRDQFRVRSAGFIANKLLYSNQEDDTKLHQEEIRLRPYLKNVILAELAMLPEKEFYPTQDVCVIFRMYHENTPTDRSRRLIDVAIENYNTTEKIPYRGIFTNPGKAEMAMQLWPDLYFKPGYTPPTPANIPEDKLKVQMTYRIGFATTVIASEVYLRHRTEYEKHEAELSTERVQNLLRSRLQERLNVLVLSDVNQILSTHSLIALYRRTYPPETDEQLLQGVISEQLERSPTGDIGTWLKRRAVLKLLAQAAIVLSNETVYGQGRVLTDEERKGLTQPQSELLTAVRTIVRDRIERMFDGSGVRVMRPEQVRALYRRRHPVAADGAFVLAVIRRGEQDLEAILAEDPEESNTTCEVKKSGGMPSRTVAEWCHSLACRVADEALYGSRKQRNLLSKGAQDRIKLAREMVREQLEEIIAGKHGVVSTFKDLHQLYRKLHRHDDDAALKERVMSKAIAKQKQQKKGAGELDERKLAAWCDAVTSQVADEALFGRPLNGLQRQALSRDEQEQTKIAREMIRVQFEKILARKHQPVRRFSDVLRLYRWRHRLSEDPVLRARVVRKMEELRATAHG